MALPMKKQTAGTVDNQNTSTKPGGPVTTGQAMAAMRAFNKKSKGMSKKTRKNVAKKLKGAIKGK